MRLVEEVLEEMESGSVWIHQGPADLNSYWSRSHVKPADVTLTRARCGGWGQGRGSKIGRNYNIIVYLLQTQQKKCKFFFLLINLFFAVVKEVKSKTEIFYSCVTV